VPAWKCGCARTGQLTATRAARASRATRATRLIPTALGLPPQRRTARTRTRGAMTALTLRNLDEYLKRHPHYSRGCADPLTRCNRRSAVPE
jgi:hypothetical protein